MSGHEQRPGDYRVICDISGFKGWASESSMTWDGKRVLNRFVGQEQQRHPQELTVTVREAAGVANARPDGDPVYLSSAVLPSDL